MAGPNWSSIPLMKRSGNTLAGKGRPRGKEIAALRHRGEPPMFNYHVIGANILDPNSRKIMDAFGGEYWHYFTLKHLDARARLVYGLQPWAVQAEAALMWANWKGDLMGNGWTMHYALPDNPAKRGSRGLYIASARAIPMREGINDRKYLETLRYYAMTRQSQADLAYLATLSDRCRKLLGNVAQMGGVENIETTVNDSSQMQAVRVEVKERILQLLGH